MSCITASAELFSFRPFIHYEVASTISYMVKREREEPESLSSSADVAFVSSRRSGRSSDAYGGHRSSVSAHTPVRREADVPAVAEASMVSRMTRHDLQKELGKEITLTWARIRRSEGTLSQDDAAARQEASKILGSMIEAIEHTTCQHHDVMTCFLCANDRKQFFDCSVLHEGYSDGYSLPNRETSYRQIMAKRLQFARYLLGSPEREFRIVTNDFVWTPSDVQQASRRIVIDKLLNGIEELSTTESALVFWDGELRLPGMHLESPKVLK